MVKIFSNAKKVVKFTLRVLPLIILFVYFGCLILNFNQYHSDITGNLMDANRFNIAFKTFLSSFNYWPDSLDNSDLIYTIFQEPFSSYQDSLIVTCIYFAFSVMFYELCLTIIFIVFDVLGYIFTVVERFLNKEERFSEK